MSNPGALASGAQATPAALEGQERQPGRYRLAAGILTVALPAAVWSREEGARADAAGIALWMTDFLHHLSPSVVGLGIGLLALLPGIGVLSIDDLRRLNYLHSFFVAATISLGRALTVTKGLDVMTKVMFAWITPLIGHHYLSTFVLYWTAFIYPIFLSSDLAMLGTSMPVLMNYALAHHLNPLALGMLWTFAGGGKLFVYQSSVLVAGYAFGYFTTKDLFRMGLALSIVSFFMLVLVVSFYWPWIGIRLS